VFIEPARVATLCVSIGLLALAAPLHAAAPASGTSAYSRDLGELVNDYRKQHGLPPLQSATILSDLAHEHAARMARENRLSHEGFEQRFARTHAPHCVENVGGGYDSPRAEFEAWRRSSTHNHNLLDPEIRYMGIAVERGYVDFFACG
jgi:uncharacterized protein YkwD